MTPDQLKARIESLAPQTQAEVIDLTGTQDHYQAIVISPAFEGLLTMKQHRLVLGLFEKEIASNEVHALTLKTFSPKQYDQYLKGEHTHDHKTSTR